MIKRDRWGKEGRRESESEGEREGGREERKKIVMVGRWIRKKMECVEAGIKRREK